MLASDLIARTRHHLDGTERGVLTTLQADLAVGAGETPLPVPASQISEGVYLSIGLETFYVNEVDTGGQVTVLRAQDGTSQSNHTDGDLVRVEPAYTDAVIFDALNDELTALAAEGVYQVKSLTRTFDPAKTGYDLAADSLGVLEVRWQSTATSTAYWPEITNYEVSNGLPTDVFPSGSAIFLYSKGESNQRFTIRYKAPLTPLAALTDDVASTGIPATAVDIPPMGAAVRLHAGRALQRADFDWQGQPRRADEARVVEVMQATGLLAQTRLKRVNDEAARLRQAQPVRLIRR